MNNAGLETAPTGATPRELMATVYRDRWRIGAAFLGGMALTVLVSLMPTEKYTAEAALLLRLGREYVYRPETGEEGSAAPLVYDLEQTLLAESRILTSRDLKEIVLDKLGMATIYPQIAASSQPPEKRRAAALLTMEQALDAELLKGSNLMDVRFTHTDPIMSAKVLSALIDAYLQRRSALFTGASYGTAETAFVARTIQLNQAEAKLAALKLQRHIHAFGEEQRLLLEQRNLLAVKRADAAQALAQANGRSGSLQASLKGVMQDVTLSTEVSPSEAIEVARKQMLELKLKERELTARYKDNNLAVEDVRADIARTEAFMQDVVAQPTRTVRSGRTPARDVVESDLLRTLADRSQAQAGAAALAREYAQVEQRLASFAESEREVLTLERERRMAEANYEAAAKRLRDEMVMEDLDRKRRSNVSIVETPQPPLAGKSIKSLVLVVGTFLSLCLALLMAFVTALTRGTVR